MRKSAVLIFCLTAQTLSFPALGQSGNQASDTHCAVFLSGATTSGGGLQRRIENVSEQIKDLDKAELAIKNAQTQEQKLKSIIAKDQKNARFSAALNTAADAVKKLQDDYRYECTRLKLSIDLMDKELPQNCPTQDVGRVKEIIDDLRTKRDRKCQTQQPIGSNGK